MPEPADLITPAALLSIIVFVLLLVAYKAVYALAFYRSMRRLADELSFHYTQPIIFRPPTINGFYLGRDVAIDVVGSDTRLRVFHCGEGVEEFTVAQTASLAGKSKAQRLGSGNQEFEERYMVAGGDMRRARKMMDAPMLARILGSGLWFTVGKRDVSWTHPGWLRDREAILAAVDLLVLAAVRADKITP
jgi:hypothetical protein